MAAVIVVKNLKKSFKTHAREAGLREAFKALLARKFKIKRALQGVNFDVKEGEILGVIGPNGAGKSNLIKLLCGVLMPEAGSVRCLGFNPWAQRVKYVQNIGAVFGPKPLLWWDLPAVDTFFFNKELYGIPSKQFGKRLATFLKILGVRDVSKTPVRDLSLGERMKCNLVAALLHNPKLVFLDEPTVGVDIIAKDKIRAFIQKTNKENKTTFIITTHDMSDIEKMCKRILIINEGKIVYDGTISAIKRKYIKEKHIEAKLLARGPPFVLQGCRVLKQTEYELCIEVDVRKQNMDLVMRYLTSKYKIADITISDPPIEEIIKAIYRGK